MYCNHVWEEIDYRNRLIMMDANPDCLCNECLDTRPMFPNYCDCE